MIRGILGAALALPLVAYASIGAYARYTADDYCWAGVLRTEGFFDAQAWWYTGYSPRYAFTFLVNLVEMAGPAIVPILPAVAMLGWLAALTWTFRVFDIRGLNALLLAAAAAVATFQTAPDLPQSLYWQTGMLTYVLPLILATILIGWIRRGSDRWWSLVVVGALTFVGGGLSETYLIPQNVALTLAIAATMVMAKPNPRRRQILKHEAAALAGGVLALAVIVASPSIAGRTGGSPADLWLALSAAIATAAYQVLRLARYFAPALILAVGLPALLADDRMRIDPRWFAVVTVAVAVTLPFCYFPSFYANNGNPPARSLIVPGAILIGYAMFVGFMLQPFVRPIAMRRRAAALAVLALVPLGIAITTVPERAVAAEHAALWDSEDVQIRASRDAGQADLTVPPLPPYLGESFVSTDRDDWFNTCVARYYGVRSIAASS